VGAKGGWLAREASKKGGKEARSYVWELTFGENVPKDRKGIMIDPRGGKEDRKKRSRTKDRERRLKEGFSGGE